MKNRLKPFLCILLLASVIIGALSSCAEKEKIPESSGTQQDATTPAPETKDPRYDDAGYLKDEVGNFNFDRDFTVFIWNDSPYIEFSHEEINGSNVSDADYQRNRKVEERCGITFKFVEEPGSSAERNNFVTKLEAMINSDPNSVDMVGAYTMASGIAALKGLYRDLASAPNFEWDKPWWPDSLLSLSKINGKLYYASGDISLNSITSMFATFFNKEFISDYKLEDPYKLVDDNLWTIDKMYEMSKGIYEDRNNDAKADAGDVFGITFHKTALDAFMMTSGMTFLSYRDGKLELNEDFCGERGNDLLEKMSSIVSDLSCVFYDHDSAENPRMNFAGGLSLFYTESVVSAPVINAGGVSYGLVPVPKASADQAEWHTPMSWSITMYSIPTTETDMECASAVMEILASESYRTTSPALYDTDLKSRYSQDSKAPVIFDLLRANILFDPGRVYSQNFNHPYNSLRSVVNKGTAWTTETKAQSKSWGKQLENILAVYDIQ